MLNKANQKTDFNSEPEITFRIVKYKMSNLVGQDSVVCMCVRVCLRVCMSVCMCVHESKYASQNSKNNTLSVRCEMNFIVLSWNLLV